MQNHRLTIHSPLYNFLLLLFMSKIDHILMHTFAKNCFQIFLSLVKKGTDTDLLNNFTEIHVILLIRGLNIYLREQIKNKDTS